MDPLDPFPAHANEKRSFAPLVIAALSSLVLLVALAGGIALFGNPADGEPSVTIALQPPAKATAPAAPRALSFSAERRVGGNLVADPELLEDASAGPLPMVGRDGRQPMAVYARVFDKNDKRPKIAIVIGGLDIGANESSAALEKLPASVTLAFAPFASDLQEWIDKARGSGHEVLLEIPMEPFDFPDSDPGPQALLVAAKPAENLKRFDWALARAAGYVGVTNLLGGRFLGESAAIEPVLGEAAKRGILFFDTGENSNSLTLTAARHTGAALALGTVLLDSVETGATIDEKLNALETSARQDGFAIGVGSVTPITVDRVAQWAMSAEARGFAVVPVSALASVPQESHADAGSELSRPH